MTPPGETLPLVTGKFLAGLSLAAAGIALALSPVVTASAAGGAHLPSAPVTRAAPGSGVVAGVVVHGRPWAGNPAG